MMRFMGMLTGILITISLYFLYLNYAMQAAPEPSPAIEAVAPSPEQGLSSPPKAPEHNAGNPLEESTSDYQLPPADLIQPKPSANAGVQEVIFWQPFQSHYSASGFARRMTDATGVRVHVLAADKKQYRVAFSYLDEVDRLTKINIIQNITGLELTP